MGGALLGGVLVAAVVGYLIVRSSMLVQASGDIPSVGPQKFHSRVTPRIGGIAILLGLFGALVALPVGEIQVLEFTVLILLCSLFAFAGGLIEDFTKHARVSFRLELTFISAALGYFFLDARITELSIAPIDWMLDFTLVSFAFTLFAVGGFAHAMNIVDGFNGLSGVVALIFLGAIAFVANTVSDAEIMWAALILGAAILGFLACNFPRGLLFLGDGGAYLIGFLIAELAVLLVHRNTEVSPWFALTLLLYPVFETVFSIYRKRILRDQSPGTPDGLHLHMLIHKRLVRRFRGPGTGSSDSWANPLTSPFLWALTLISAIPAILLWNETVRLQAVSFIFAAIYVWLYSHIVRFRTPSFLTLRRTRRTTHSEHPEVVASEPAEIQHH